MRAQNDTQIHSGEGEFHTFQSAGQVQQLRARFLRVMGVEKRHNHSLGDIEAEVGINGVLVENTHDLLEDRSRAHRYGRVVGKGPHLPTIPHAVLEYAQEDVGNNGKE